MTAVELLRQDLDAEIKLGTKMVVNWDMYLEMEKKQIIDAAERWKGTDFAEKYYAETYGSKIGTSLEWNGEVIQGNDENFKQFSLYEHKETIATSDTPTSSQTEISAVKYLSDAILSQKYNNDIFDLHNIIQNAFLIEKELINKQTEISDEEILKEGKTMFNSSANLLYAFHVGATWYREQLKKKQ